MAIALPIVGQEISAANFGIPVANEVNRITPLVDAPAQYFGHVGKNAAQALGAGATVTVTWPTVVSDPKGMWDAATNSWKVPVKGVYIFAYSVYGGAEVGTCQTFVTFGGYRMGWSSASTQGAGSDAITGNSFTVHLNVNDLIKVTAYSSGARTLGYAGIPSAFTCQLLART